MTTPDPETPRPEAAQAPVPEPAVDPPPAAGFPWPIAILAAVVLVVLARPMIRGLLPAPQLAPALRLMKEGRFAEAERKLKDYLAYEPSSSQARTQLALALLNREDPKPAEALAMAETVRPSSPIEAADVQVLRGKALEALDRPGAAEAAYKAALKAYPLIGEAGWLLLQLYYMEGRQDESRALALRLAETEPDPGDRVRLLLEPARFEAEPLAAAGVIPKFKDAVAADPDDVPAALAYYRALAEDGTGIEKALTGLRGLVARHPDSLPARLGLLFALDSVGDLDGLQKALSEVPPALAENPAIAGYRGRLALGRKDYETAIKDLEIASAAAPSDAKTLHLLADAYRFAGKTSQAEAAKARENVREAARVELRAIKGKEQDEGRPGLFEEAASRRDLGYVPNPGLYKRLASNRERMGHPAEARAWHEQVLRDDPDDAESREAIRRLTPDAA